MKSKQLLNYFIWIHLLKGKEAGPPTRAVNIIRFISKIKKHFNG